MLECSYGGVQVPLQQLALVGGALFVKMMTVRTTGSAREDPRTPIIIEDYRLSGRALARNQGTPEPPKESAERQVFYRSIVQNEEKASEASFHEMTDEVGDMYLLHPFMHIVGETENPMPADPFEFHGTYTRRWLNAARNALAQFRISTSQRRLGGVENDRGHSLHDKFSISERSSQDAIATETRSLQRNNDEFAFYMSDITVLKSLPRAQMHKFTQLYAS
ncbi:hypothetical protein R3P38DRAFT_2798645 [Favolaschia claudopus]|uniref:Uncharacterized protein n=1 Tax=Favolaschia claudopus TaxID=2862362 RepID=A0AAW0A1X9_9AGAR